MASQKLRHYFQECSITVVSEVPLNDIINNRGAIGCIAKWAIELLPFEITYGPRRAIKSQVLADFVTEWMEAELPKEYNTYSNWIMYFDGSKMLAGLGIQSNTYSKYYARTPTTQQNMRPYYMVSGWQSPWAFNAWRCVGTRTSQYLK